ncbi:helix-turn-helix transcriptional regulator [Sphingobium subterraneum]|uniref:DNA-binding CsgD family transcriptional regulator n=1 Tax=Sphingobium subterraneum TaxID=627688 RepID=A0A841IVW6_9SPHN|nr:helix-turn-helix transcriptional regulator [Sphingobium subterraneum]MBB6122312.1 DNA-binding CsgD family transcriptional regulator [Sphingobium subterraneum]
MPVPRLIDIIYEAAVQPALWPDVLQQVADHSRSRCCVFLSRSPDGVDWTTSTDSQQVMNDYVNEGWANDMTLVQPLFEEQWPGFRTETDYRTPEEIAALPVHKSFFIPRGFSHGMGTLIQGAGDVAVQITVQGFASDAAARAAVPTMDALRPHLARAISLSALLRSRSQIVVDSLSLAGVAAAVISTAGKLRSANSLFLDRMGDRIIESRGRLRFIDMFLSTQMSNALSRFRNGRERIQSVGVPGVEPSLAFAIHILPIIGTAREVCDSDGVLMIIADPSNRNVPSSDLLRLLFDLTPAEARLARLIARGQTVSEVATRAGIQENTVRAHLKAIYAKTGFSRQTDLALALVSLAAGTRQDNVRETSLP